MTTKNANNEQKADAPAPFLPEVVALADQVQESEINIPDLAEFIQHQARGKECHQVAITVGKMNTRFSYNVDRVLIRVWPIDSASQKYVRVALRASILRLCY